MGWPESKGWLRRGGDGDRWSRLQGAAQPGRIPTPDEAPTLAVPEQHGLGPPDIVARSSLGRAWRLLDQLLDDYVAGQLMRPET